MKFFIKTMSTVTALAIIFFSAACGANKIYSNAEEWYKDNSKECAALATGFTLSEEAGTTSVYAEDNTLIYCYESNQIIFGQDELYDKFNRATLDEKLEADKDFFQNAIDEVSLQSGVDAGEISVRIEVFNPGASTPSYTKDFTK